MLPASSVGATRLGGETPAFVSSGAYELLTELLLVGAGVKLAYELSVLRHRGDPQHSVWKRTALLLMGDLGAFTRARFCCGVLGALVFPGIGLLLTRSSHTTGAAFPFAWFTIISALAFGLSLCGELLERYLFFATAPASKMPGAIA